MNSLSWEFLTTKISFDLRVFTNQRTLFTLSSKFSKEANCSTKFRKIKVSSQRQKSNNSWKDYWEDSLICIKTELCIVILSLRTSWWETKIQWTLLLLILDLPQMLISTSICSSDVEHQAMLLQKSLPLLKIVMYNLNVIFSLLESFFTLCWWKNHFSKEQNMTKFTETTNTWISISTLQFIKN